MESEKFCLKWNDFESNISTAFKELREDKDFFDVTLACDDIEQIQAHKVILAACSPFFRAILKRHRHDRPLLYLKGVKYTDLVAVINFMYHGEVNVAQEELNTFLSVAEELKVKGLTQSKQTASNDNKQHVSKTIHEKQTHESPQKKFKPNTTSANLKRSTHDDDVEEVLHIKSEPVILPNDCLDDPMAAAGSAQDTAVVENSENSHSAIYGEFGEFCDYDETGEGYDNSVGTLQTNIGGNKDLNTLLDSMIERYHDGTTAKYLCQSCGKIIASKKDMRRHVEIHLDLSHPCGICKKVLKTRSSLAAHYSIYHKNEVISPWSMI